MGQIYEGVVLRWLPAGFGFLYTQEISRKVFFHIRDWNQVLEPVVGDRVRFEMAASRIPGRPDAAINVTLIHAGADALAGGVR
jgi:cold shock CspA family protein